MSSIGRNAIRIAILGGALLAASTAVAQQSGASERAAERRARAAGTGDAKAPRQEPVYPDATRSEPGIKASAKGGPRLQKLFAAYDKDDAGAVQPLADEIISSASANAYEKSIAARIIGSMLMGTDDARALAYMQQAVSFNGLSNNEHYETMLVAAQLQLQAEQYPAALTSLDAFLSETKSTRPEHQVYKANALFQMERYPEAIALLKPAIAAGQPKPEWTQLLMAAYSEAGQPADAAVLAEQIAARTPGDKRAQVNLAGTYLQSEQYDKAAAVYERLRAAGQLTEDRDYRNLFSLYVSAEGKERDAIAVINEGLDKGVLKPDHQTYMALAQAYFFTDQPGPSIEAYQKAAPMAPDGETYLNLAKVLANQGRAAESKAAAQQAIDKGVKNPDDARRLLLR